MTGGPNSSLGDIAEFVRGITFTPGDVVEVGSPGSIACMRTKNVQADLDLEDVWGVGERFVRRDDQVLQFGDVLVSSANSWNLVGKCCWIPELPWKSTFGGFVSVLRGDRDKVDPRFLYRWFSSVHVQAIVRSCGQKTTNISNLNVDRCLALRLSLPSLAEQRRIAKILDAADALRAKRRAALAELDGLTQAIFVQLFEGRDSDAWPWCTVEEIASPRQGSIRTGPFGSQLLHEEFTSEGIAVLGIDNVVSNEFSWGERRFISEEKYQRLQRYTVFPGDVLITIMGTCGRCAVVPPSVPLAINTKHLCCISVDRTKCVPEFLQAYFLLHGAARAYLRATAKGAVMDGLNMGLIKAMPIPLAPIELQVEFARGAARVERLRAAHRRHLAELDALFASLQHRAFRGEL